MKKMFYKNSKTQLIFDLIKEKKVGTAKDLSGDVEKKFGVKISSTDVSYRLYRLWKKNLLLRAALTNSSGKLEHVYSVNDLPDRTISLNLNGKIQEIQLAEYTSSSVSRHLHIRSIIKNIFDTQEKPEPLYPYELCLIMKQKYQLEPNSGTIGVLLNRMVYKFGELARSKMRFEEGHLYHPDLRVVENWIQNPPHKGLLPDEKGLIQLIRDRTVITASDIRKEAIRRNSSLPTSFSTISFKIRKLKQLIPWIRTEYYAANSIVYDTSINQQALEEKLKQVRFWLSDLGKRKTAYGREFESFGAYIFSDIVHMENKEWFSTNIEVERNRRGRFGEFDVIISHSFGPPEFGLRETMVFEFKTAGRVGWKEMFGYDPKRHKWGFITKLEKEKEDGIFRGKFVRPVLVLAHTIEPGLPYELTKKGVTIIYLSELLDYLERKGIDPDSILKAINAKYYQPK